MNLVDFLTGAILVLWIKENPFYDSLWLLLFLTVGLLIGKAINILFSWLYRTFIKGLKANKANSK